ncbi:mitochondrial E3 ubiquitin protein ligase 1 [Venturia canescens]|uniref:mitochondrial E3 ubiquitin protein ligase 1 n=1 Tax=Venturia canescens TaxID=32260 RepID=UPI001C9CF1D9|nr:mitochondrial E3 ubiquitin protein ligase 1 [Venturia canescens]
MDYLGEIIALGIDSIIFGICLKQYYHCKNAVTSIKGAEYHDIGPNLFSSLNYDPDGKLSYVVIRGLVTPLGKPFRSINNDAVTGVIQKLSVKEHVVARTTAGFWSDQENTMQEIYNSMPFALRRGQYKVEVHDAVSAEILDMDVIKDEFTPSVPSIKDYLWGFFTGVRQRGLQSTEQMLREDTVITGIGELARDSTNPHSLILQPPADGTPFYLTTMSVGSLLRKLDERRKTYRWLCLVFGAIGVLIGGIVVRRYLKDREEQRLADELQQALEETRRTRRRRVREKDLREEQLCVVCRTNPREIILLPCGHVCLCEDCADDITSDCPVCRAPIAQKNAAYIA